MAAYAQDPARTQRRTMVFVAAILLHIVLIWGFASGLAHNLKQFIAPPIEASVVKEEKVEDKPPPPPPPELERPPVQVVAPEINISLTPDAPPPPITQVTTAPVITPPRPPPAPVAVIPDQVLKPISIPNPEDRYPSSAKQAGQEGVVKIKLCVTAASKIESVAVADSSGFPLLDDAGVSVVKGGRFQAAKKGGQNIDSCATVPIRFSLKKN